MSHSKRSRQDTDNTSTSPPPKRHKPSASNTTNTSNSDTKTPLNRPTLPIDECKDEILSLINNPSNPIVIITGDTGSGKSTQLSQILYRSGLYQSILITQPRRIGAVSLARRVSKEMNTKLGDTVGYTIRFNDYTSQNTHIRYVTDGILLRELTTDPNNVTRKYDIIILDEAHERSLQTDILFSILCNIIKQSKNKNNKYEFKLLITSATLNVDKFSSFFMGAPVYHISGRCYPIEVLHCTTEQRHYINACVDTCLTIHTTESGSNGHILCFLTGRDEIERAVQMLGQRIDDSECEMDCVILPAYGSMNYDAQQRIFARTPPNCRKIIFATNIAETSLTVSGIVYVIDCGLVKQKWYNYESGMNELIIGNISHISAVQRKGRCGRTKNGKCYRLYTRKELSAFNEETVPEIMRISLESTILCLKAFGISDVIYGFEYLDKPKICAFVNALNKLYLLSAIDKNGNLNREIGMKMSRLPMDPIFSKILIESERFKATDIAMSLVSIISANNGNASDLFLRPQSESDKRKYYEMHSKFDSKYGDIISRLLLFNTFMQNESFEWTQKYFVKYNILRNALRVREQLRVIIQREFAKDVLCKQSTKPLKAIRKVLAKSLFMQTAKVMSHFGTDTNTNNKNESKKRKLVFRVYGDGCDENVYIHPCSMACLREGTESELKWIVYLDIVCTSKPFMRGICAVKYEWIKDLLPKMRNKMEWVTTEQKMDKCVNETTDNGTGNRKEQNQLNAKITETDKQNNIDSVKERYLKRKMLKNKLKCL